MASHADELVRLAMERAEAEKKLDEFREARYPVQTGHAGEHRWPTHADDEDWMAEERALEADFEAKDEAYRRYASGL